MFQTPPQELQREIALHLKRKAKSDALIEREPDPDVLDITMQKWDLKLLPSTTRPEAVRALIRPELSEFDMAEFVSDAQKWHIVSGDEIIDVDIREKNQRYADTEKKIGPDLLAPNVYGAKYYSLEQLCDCIARFRRMHGGSDVYWCKVLVEYKKRVMATYSKKDRVSVGFDRGMLEREFRCRDIRALVLVVCTFIHEDQSTIRFVTMLESDTKDSWGLYDRYRSMDVRMNTEEDEDVYHPERYLKEAIDFQPDVITSTRNLDPMIDFDETIHELSNHQEEIQKRLIEVTGPSRNLARLREDDNEDKEEYAYVVKKDREEDVLMSVPNIPAGELYAEPFAKSKPNVAQWRALIQPLKSETELVNELAGRRFMQDPDGASHDIRIGTHYTSDGRLLGPILDESNYGITSDGVEYFTFRGLCREIGVMRKQNGGSDELWMRVFSKYKAKVLSMYTRRFAEEILLREFECSDSIEFYDMIRVLVVENQHSLTYLNEFIWNNKTATNPFRANGGDFYSGWRFHNPRPDSIQQFVNLSVMLVFPRDFVLDVNGPVGERQLTVAEKNIGKWFKEVIERQIHSAYHHAMKLNMSMFANHVDPRMADRNKQGLIVGMEEDSLILSTLTYGREYYSFRMLCINIGVLRHQYETAREAQLEQIKQESELPKEERQLFVTFPERDGVYWASVLEAYRDMVLSRYAHTFTLEILTREFTCNDMDALSSMAVVFLQDSQYESTLGSKFDQVMQVLYRVVFFARHLQDVPAEEWKLSKQVAFATHRSTIFPYGAKPSSQSGDSISLVSFVGVSEAELESTRKNKFNYMGKAKGMFQAHIKNMYSSILPLPFAVLCGFDEYGRWVGDRADYEFHSKRYDKQYSIGYDIQRLHDVITGSTPNYPSEFRCLMANIQTADDVKRLVADQPFIDMVPIYRVQFLRHYHQFLTDRKAASRFLHMSDGRLNLHREFFVQTVEHVRLFVQMFCPSYGTHEKDSEMNSTGEMESVIRALLAHPPLFHFSGDMSGVSGKVPQSGLTATQLDFLNLYRSNDGMSKEELARLAPTKPEGVSKITADAELDSEFAKLRSALVVDASYKREQSALVKARILGKFRIEYDRMVTNEILKLNDRSISGFVFKPRTFQNLREPAIQKSDILTNDLQLIKSRFVDECDKLFVIENINMYVSMLMLFDASTTRMMDGLAEVLVCVFQIPTAVLLVKSIVNGSIGTNLLHQRIQQKAQELNVQQMDRPERMALLERIVTGNEGASLSSLYLLDYEQMGLQLPTRNTMSQRRVVTTPSMTKTSSRGGRRT
jgi:hypothetical protein